MFRGFGFHLRLWKSGLTEYYNQYVDFILQINPAEPGQHEWKWGGCSDNVKFGNKFTKKFVNSIEKGRGFRHVVNMHNNEAGGSVNVNFFS